MKLLLAAFFSAAILAPAWSAPIATLTFRSPTGTALDTDSIEIWLTLALDNLSNPLITDGSGRLTPLPALGDIAANLFGDLPNGVDEHSATRAVVNVAFRCSGNFSSTCMSGPPYDFTFNDGPASFMSAPNLNLQPGSITDYLFGTFTPTGGRAPAGTYSFEDAAFYIHVLAGNDRDENGEPLHIADIPIADTSMQVPFTRDVLATVPEPATYSYILAGLVLGVGMKRARASRQSR